jgi:Rad3-related DNA helicase
VTHWKQYFPFPGIRSEQEEAIEFALKAYKDGKKFVVLELGTGVGKSAIAIAIARYLHASNSESSYVLTTQKLLQEQYMRDFEKSGLTLLKSATAYTCQMFDDDCGPKSSCSDIQKIIKSKSPASKNYPLCQNVSCRYMQAKQDFFDNFEGITNYSYFLATNAYAYQKIPSRELLILDEGHNIESVVSDFVTISFSNHFYKNVLNVRTPTVNASQEEVFKWLSETCLKKLRKVTATKKTQLESVDPNSPIMVEMSKELEDLENKQKKIVYFKDMYDPKKWVLDISKTDRRGERVYEFKPLDVSMYVRKLLLDYADKVLILSATIIDIDMFCETNGMGRDEVAYLRMPSPFPVENRLVHYMPVGSMSKKNIDTTMPVLVAAVEEILKQHPNEKGIIHCVNYRIARELSEKIGQDRLLIHDAADREEILKFHKETDKPTVLLSPSMTEGVDLADNQSRFQIICKIPFPYLGDVAVKRKTELNQRWYSYQTVKTIVQALGRSIRNENDHAVSYILDSDWQRFYRTNSTMFPPDFEQILRQ